MSLLTKIKPSPKKTLAENVFGSADPVFRKEPGEYLTTEEQEYWRTRYEDRAKGLYQGHFRQTRELALELRKKYLKPVFGSVFMYDILHRLAECIDPTDTELYCVNQLTHSLQVAQGMENDGVEDESLILTALLHDFGKVAELVGEEPANINGPNEPIGDYPSECGLDNVITTWNHDEFAYQKIKDHVPDHVGWLTRYHSLRFETAKDLMDERDKAYYDRYLGLFRKYDLGTKSIFNLPSKKIADYRALIEKYFPERTEI